MNIKLSRIALWLLAAALFFGFTARTQAAPTVVTETVITSTKHHHRHHRHHRRWHIRIRHHRRHRHHHRHHRHHREKVVIETK